MDRISQLPQPILHHILSFLSQRDAVQTCVLSKPWRYLGSTRLKLEFCQSNFKGNNLQKFMSLLHKTLQRYRDQNLSIQEFVLEMSEVESKSVSLLENCISMVVQNKGMQTFHLSLASEETPCFNLSSSIFFKAKSLRKLYLEGCKLNQINNSVSLDNVLSKHLQTLILNGVHIDQQTLDKILSGCTSIEMLKLRYCDGFEEFQLSSLSIKRLIINMGRNRLTKATIDAANLLYFEFSGDLPHSISFTTTSNEWKSRISVGLYFDNDDAAALATWFTRLREVLEALSKSRITLKLCHISEKDWHIEDIYGCFNQPVVVEHLELTGYYSSSYFPGFLNCLFCIFRPRYLELWWIACGVTERQIEICRLAEFICDITLKDRGEMSRCYFWQHDLEESSIQLWSENEEEWYPVQRTSLPVYILANKIVIRFRLKWKD